MAVCLFRVHLRHNEHKKRVHGSTDASMFSGDSFWHDASAVATGRLKSGPSVSIFVAQRVLKGATRFVTIFNLRSCHKAHHLGVPRWAAYVAPPCGCPQMGHIGGVAMWRFLRKRHWFSASWYISGPLAGFSGANIRSTVRRR